MTESIAPLNVPAEDEAQFRAAFDQAALGIVQIDMAGYIVHANRKLCELHGYAREELVGMRASDLCADSGAAAQPQVERLRRGEIASYIGRREFIRKSGQTYPARVSVALIQGPHPYFMSIVEDLSEQVRAEAALRALNSELETRIAQRTEQLAQRNEELRNFAYTLAHDLRAPLGTLDGFTRQLAAHVGPSLDETGRHYTSRILASVRLMAELTDGLLELANLSQAGLAVEPVDLAAFARQWWERVRQEDPRPGLEVRVSEVPAVMGDVRLLHSLMENLLGNAHKFTGRKAQGLIEFGCQLQADGGPVFFVRDNGAGFDPAYASKLFKPFQRLHHAQEFAGTGIGLAMVRKIVLRHGGRVWAEGQVGQGATFRFSLGVVAA